MPGGRPVAFSGRMPWNTEENPWQQACGEREREREGVGRGWAPFVSTVITLPVAYFGFAFAGLHGMLCDSCDGAVAEEFDREFGFAMTAFSVVIGLSLLMLTTSWVLPGTERHRGTRLLLAALAPLVIVVGFAVFTGAVNAIPTE